MTRASIGVIGHVDHGKTALVRALTGMETDRLPEEKRRGISIALGFAYLSIEGSEIDLIDMPGHEQFVRTMIAGSTGIAAVLLVVSANERVKPQTEEHLAIARLLGVRSAVIAITKCDLVTLEDAKSAACDAASLAARAGIKANAPIITSVITKTGLTELRDAIAEMTQTLEQPDDRGFCWLPVDRAFGIAGHGTVVTGTLRHGMLTPTTDLELLPARVPIRIRGLQVHGRQTASALPGQRVAVNLRDLEPAQIPRGGALATTGLLRSATWLSVDLRLLGSAPRALRTTQKVRLLVGTLEVEARLRLLDRDVLMPGESCVAQLHCAEFVLVPTRERFVLRELSPAVTTGGGTILDTGTQRLRRRTETILARLQALAADGVPAMLAHELAYAGAAGCPVDDLARLAGVAPARIVTLLPGVDAFVTAAHVAVLSMELDAVVGALRAALAALDEREGRKGLTLTRLSVELRSRPSIPVLEEAVARLVADGAARRDGGAVRLSRPDQARAEVDQDAALSVLLEETLRAAGLQPPDYADLIAVNFRASTVLERLTRVGTIVRATDHAQKRHLLFHRDAVRAAQDILAPLLERGSGLLTKDAGAALGISRKFSIPLLEYLDAIRFTRRVGDRRVLVRLARDA